MPLRDQLVNDWINYVLRAQAYTPPANTYLAAFTDSPGGTEVTGGSYARVTIPAAAGSWDAPASKATQNTNELAFPQASADWGTIVAVGLYDALTVGNELVSEWLTTQNWEFTAEATGDAFTSYGHGFSLDDRVAFFGSNLPTGIDAVTLYWIINPTGTTFQVSLTQGGAAVNFSANGNGKAMLVVPQTVNSGNILKVAAGQLDFLFT